jgi:hypothetical protein
MILLIGPSGIGKTTAGRAAVARLPGCTFAHLDGVATSFAKRWGYPGHEHVSQWRKKLGNDDVFFLIGMWAAAGYESAHRGLTLVLDVGAGFQDSRFARDMPAVHPTILITATREAALPARTRTTPPPDSPT